MANITREGKIFKCGNGFVASIPKFMWEALGIVEKGGKIKITLEGEKVIIEKA